MVKETTGEKMSKLLKNFINKKKTKLKEEAIKYLLELLQLIAE